MGKNSASKPQSPDPKEVISLAKAQKLAASVKQGNGTGK